MPSTLPYYWQLASASTSDRLVSSRSLVETLASQQKEANIEIGKVAIRPNSKLFNDGLQSEQVMYIDGKIVAEAEKSLEEHNSAEVTYAIRRLVKGLASHRDSSRLGFSVALCELISRMKSLSAHHMIVLVLSYSSPSGKVKGQEERDLLFARLFGLYAIVRSGLLFEQDLAQAEDFKRVIEIVWLLGRSKTWLRESSSWVIVEAIQVLSTRNVAWKMDCLSWLAKKICQAKDVSSESIAIYLALECSAATIKDTLPHLSSPDLLASTNLATLARILKEGIGTEDSMASSGSGPVQGQVHFVWDMILQQYTKERETLAGKKAPFGEAYRVLVDEALFASTSSDQRKSWGFQIFEKAIHKISEEDLPCIFTANFMRTWTNHLADQNRMLHKAAQRCIRTVQSAVRDRPSIGLPIIRQLITQDGRSSFPVKVVESILASMDSPEGVSEYIDYLIRLACRDSKEEMDSTRRWALDQLLGVTRNSNLPTNDKSTCVILSFLATQGFFTIKSGKETEISKASELIMLPQPAFSTAVKAICRTRFFSCLSEVCDQATTIHSSTEGKVRRKQGRMMNDQTWISKAFDIMDGIEKDTLHFTALYSDAKDEVFSQGKEFSHTLSKALQKCTMEERKTKIQDFQAMLLAGMLYLRKDLAHNKEDEASSISSMIDCGHRLLLGKKREEEEPSAMELFVHCVVSYLERPSAFLRSVATQAFASFSDEMDLKALEEILEQLGFNTSKNGEEGDVLEEDDENMEEDEEDEEEEEEEIMSDSVSETSATSASSSKEEAVDPVFLAKLQEVLKAGGAADSDAESSVDDDNKSFDSSSSPSNEFDDDQMLLIDDKLADIFRQKLGSRREEDEAKKETISLHIKLLDLLDVFVRKQSSSELCIETVLPLFTIALEKDVALGQLKQRASTILQKTLCKSKDAMNSTASADLVFGPMDAVHKMAATKLGTPEFKLCSAVNIYLSKSCKEDDLLNNQIRSLYLSTLNDFINRKSNNLKPQFLSDVFQRLPILGFSLRNELLEAASAPQESAKHSYRQVQALDMLRITLVNLANTGKKEDDLVSFLPKVSDCILEIIIKEKFRLKEIVKLGLDFARLSKKLCRSQTDLEMIWSPIRINKAIETISKSKSLANASSVQALLQQLLAITGEQGKKKKPNGKRMGDEQTKKEKKRHHITI